MNNLTPAEKVSRATNKLLINHPFFGVLLLRLQIKEDPTQPTAWVNGTQLGYNPEWIDSLPNAQIMGLLAHEIMHCVYMHHTRRKNRNPRKWNRAGDHVINLGLLESNFELPPDGLWDEQYKDMTTDQVYHLLPEEENGGEGNGSGWDECRDSEAGSSSEQQAIEKEWTIATKQAAQAAKNQGNLSANLEKLIDEVTEVKVPWQEVLRNFMTAPRKDDYSLLRPNRRFISSNLYLPSMYSEGLGEVVIVLDTSGSTYAYLAEFQTEVNAILEDCNPEKIYVIHCDTCIKGDVDEYSKEDLPQQLTRRGGGGTDFTAPFNWVEKNIENPAALIYLTDLYGDCSAPEPMYPTFWVCVSSKTDAAFGEVITMN